MNVDLILAGLVLLFAVLGAFAGAAKQVANLAALVAAYFCARPLGTALGPKAAQLAQVPLLVGVIGATLAVFLLVWVGGRYALTRTLQGLLAGKGGSSRLDHTLGFLLGGLKVAVILYVLVCALSFIEQNVTLAGRRVGLSPKDSIAFSFARDHNVFAMTQFAAVQDLVRVGRAQGDPAKAARLKTDPAFLALKKDPRFTRALDQKGIRKAIEEGDYRAILRSDGVLQLIQDPVISSRLAAAAAAAEDR